MCDKREKVAMCPFPCWQVLLMKHGGREIPNIHQVFNKESSNIRWSQQR